MKTIKTILVSSLSLLLFSCGEPKTPSEVALKSTEYMENGDIEDALDYYNVEDEKKEGIINFFDKNMGKLLLEDESKRNGKPIKFEVISESISEDGNKAYVNINVTFEKTGVKKKSITLVKVDEKWMLEDNLDAK